MKRRKERRNIAAIKIRGNAPYFKSGGRHTK